LLGLVREGEGVAAQVLVSLGADLTRVRQQVIQLLSGYQGREGEEDVPAGTIAQLQRRRPGFSAVPVGKQWSAQVVRTGRRPDDYANGYAELAELVIAFGFDLDDMDAGEITLSSVEKTEGPGFMVSVKHRIDDETMGEGPPS
jgi:hypothetical protein